MRAFEMIELFRKPSITLDLCRHWKNTKGMCNVKQQYTHDSTVNYGILEMLNISNNLAFPSMYIYIYAPLNTHTHLSSTLQYTSKLLPTHLCFQINNFSACRAVAIIICIHKWMGGFVRAIVSKGLILFSQLNSYNSAKVSPMNGNYAQNCKNVIVNLLERKRERRTPANQ